MAVERASDRDPDDDLRAWWRSEMGRGAPIPALVQRAFAAGRASGSACAEACCTASAADVLEAHGVPPHWLSETHAALAVPLLRRPGAWVPVQELVRAVWRLDWLDKALRHNLRVHVARLRPPLAAAGWRIENGGHFGYRAVPCPPETGRWRPPPPDWRIPRGRLLDASQVAEMRRRAGAGEAHHALADRYGITCDYVQRILRGDAWRRDAGRDA
jgi:hypothetical protein